MQDRSCSNPFLMTPVSNVFPKAHPPTGLHVISPHHSISSNISMCSSLIKILPCWVSLSTIISTRSDGSMWPQGLDNIQLTSNKPLWPRQVAYAGCHTHPCQQFLKKVGYSNCLLWLKLAYHFYRREKSAWHRPIFPARKCKLKFNSGIVVLCVMFISGER